MLSYGCRIRCVLQYVEVCCSLMQYVRYSLMHLLGLPYDKRKRLVERQSSVACIPQHTSIHCNTLQHTATHCNTLQHTATHCITLQHTATHCNTLQHTATHCNTLQHTATHTHSGSHVTRRSASRWFLAYHNKLQHPATYCNAQLYR